MKDEMSLSLLLAPCSMLYALCSLLLAELTPCPLFGLTAGTLLILEEERVFDLQCNK